MCGARRYRCYFDKVPPSTPRPHVAHRRCHCYRRPFSSGVVCRMRWGSTVGGRQWRNEPSIVVIVPLGHPSLTRKKRSETLTFRQKRERGGKREFSRVELLTRCRSYPLSSRHARICPPAICRGTPYAPCCDAQICTPQRFSTQMVIASI